ncbi:MAG: sigma-70 family RNA polymerase sigma factor [Pseudomonadota bacterium]
MTRPALSPGKSSQPVSDASEEACDPLPDLARLYRAHFKDLCRFVGFMFGKGPPEPEDVAQLAFARLAADTDVTRIRHPKAFLQSTARNIVISEMRARGVRYRYVQEAVSLQSGEQGDDLTPERVLLGKENMSVVRRALDRMPAKRRRLFTLSRIEGLSFAEISRQTGLSQTAVKKHVARAMADLDKALAETE